MRRRLKEKASFFKVLSNMDFKNLLRVSPCFFQKYGLTPPEKVKLRVHSGRTWIVGVERLDGVFCFTEGWPDFVHDCWLQLGEFVVFTLLAESKFKVEIYDTSFCQREIPFHTHCAYVKQKRKRRGVGDPLYFQLLLKKQHRSRITLRKNFWEEAGLGREKCVMVEYGGAGAGERSCTCVALDRRDEGRIDLARGWPEFRNKNKLEYGLTYSFRFNRDTNAIYVHQVT